VSRSRHTNGTVSAHRATQTRRTCCPSPRGMPTLLAHPLPSTFAPPSTLQGLSTTHAVTHTGHWHTLAQPPQHTPASCRARRRPRTGAAGANARTAAAAGAKMSTAATAGTAGRARSHPATSSASKSETTRSQSSAGAGAGATPASPTSRAEPRWPRAENAGCQAGWQTCPTCGKHHTAGRGRLGLARDLVDRTGTWRWGGAERLCAEGGAGAVQSGCVRRAISRRRAHDRGCSPLRRNTAATRGGLSSILFSDWHRPAATLAARRALLARPCPGLRAPSLLPSLHADERVACTLRRGRAVACSPAHDRPCASPRPGCRLRGAWPTHAHTRIRGRAAAHTRATRRVT